MRQQAGYIWNDTNDNKDENCSFHGFESIFVACGNVATLFKPRNYLIAIFLT